MTKNITVVNDMDSLIFDNAYEVSLHNYDNQFYKVYARCEQDALDVLVDWLEETEQTGYFWTMDEFSEFEYSDEFIQEAFITAGNHCHYLDMEHTWIKQIQGWK